MTRWCNSGSRRGGCEQRNLNLVLKYRLVLSSQSSIVMPDQENLWEKCSSGKVEEVRGALQAGADPNSTGGPRNSTCLMEASWKNHHEVVALLLSRPGIQVNARDEKNYTALHWACYNGSLASLSKLLAVPKVEVNERNSWGNTPMMVAIHWGKTEAVRLMAAVPAVDLDVKDTEGNR